MIDRPELLAPVLLVAPPVLLGVVRFAAGELDDLDAHQVFLHVLVQSRDRVAHEPEDLAHRHAEDVGRHRGHGDDQQEQARHLGADVEHEEQRQEERHELPREHAEPEQQVEQVLHVVRDAGHDPADGDPVVERGRLVLERGEQVEAQVPERLERAARERQPVREHEERLRQHEHDEQHHGRRQRLDRQGRRHPLRRVDQAVVRHVRGRGARQQDGVHDDAPLDDRQQHAHGGRAHHQQNAREQRDPVGLHPAQQPREQAHVQRLVRQLRVERRVVAGRRVRPRCSRFAHPSAPTADTRAGASASRSCSSRLLRARSRSWLLWIASRSA